MKVLKNHEKVSAWKKKTFWNNFTTLCAGQARDLTKWWLHLIVRVSAEFGNLGFEVFIWKEKLHF